MKVTYKFETYGDLLHHVADYYNYYTIDETPTTFINLTYETPSSKLIKLGDLEVGQIFYLGSNKFIKTDLKGDMVDGTKTPFVCIDGDANILGKNATLNSEVEVKVVDVIGETE